MSARSHGRTTPTRWPQPKGPLASMIAGEPVKGASDVGYAEDIVKGAAAAWDAASAGLAGMAGDLSEYWCARPGLWATRKVGAR